MIPNSHLICPDCGVARLQRGVPCQVCGSTDPTQVARIGTAEEIDMALPIGVLAISGSPADQVYRIQVQTHCGTRSDARLRDGTVILSVSGTFDVGRRGEPYALTTLLAILCHQGVHPIRRIAKDDRGEDAIVEINGKRYTIQLITVPSDSRFWSFAARGTGNTAVGIEAAVGWIRHATLAKFQSISRLELQRTVLGLDTRHAGVLASKQISSAYLISYLDPYWEFGFAAVWLVGPDTSSSAQIGTASWDLPPGCG